jgi:PAS domain S-box-containing protein
MGRGIDSNILSSSLQEIQRRLDDLRTRCISDPGNAEEILSDALEQLQETFEELSVANEALLQSDTELRLVTDNVPLLLAHVSSDLRYIFVNQSYADWFHLKRSEIIGRHISEVLSKEGYEATLENIKKALSGEKVDCEVVVQKEEGPCVMHVAFIPQLDEHRTTWSYYTVTQDITEHKKADEALHDSEKRYRTLFENMLEGFAYCKVVYDDQGRPIDFICLDVNSAFERLTGLKDVIGKRITEAIPGIKEAHPELFGASDQVDLTDRPEKFEIEFKPLGIWLSISAFSTG